MTHSQANTHLDTSLARQFNDNSPLSQVDWQAPWLQHLAIRGLLVKETSNQPGDDSAVPSIAHHLNSWRDKLAASQYTLADKTRRFATGRGQALRFVPQDDLPEGMAYETFIARSGGVPTRDNFHDLFNGSIWLTFPKSKALLNRYQAQAIDEQGISGMRGRVRDTITVFDENGAILVTAKPSIGEALAAFNWQGCLVSARAYWDNPLQPNKSAQAAVYIFGHALLEQLISPRKPLCAHTLIISVEPDFFELPIAERMAHLDTELAARLDELLQDESVTPRAFSPLPILGVPHFWPDNQDPEFYEDKFVFRSGRRRQN
ncbi:DUF3025 domain-containing protein [Psychrobacter pygoscelis]|uniref:DUF3025 domain-containing protein n=1 Tax=Psychrobacter pygoscelis TaxID=2488563 RepID=UPI00103F09D1|nr:DUF3025 domain-containing protein [Psychrobacter pygoscelis]